VGLSACINHIFASLLLKDIEIIHPYYATVTPPHCGKATLEMIKISWVHLYIQSGAWYVENGK
jgi:hypothetical protein